MLLDFPFIGDDIDGVDDQHGDQEHGAQAHAGKQGDAGDILRHAHGEGVHQARGKAGGRADGYHGHSGHLIQAQRQRHGDADGNEDGDLVGHAHGGSEYGKQGEEHGNDKNFLSLQLLSYRAAQGQDGSARVHQLEGAADDQQEGDHVRRFQNALIHDYRNLEKADRAGPLRGIASRLNHGFSGNRILIAHKLAGRDEPKLQPPQ